MLVHMALLAAMRFRLVDTKVLQLRFHLVNLSVIAPATFVHMKGNDRMKNGAFRSCFSRESVDVIIRDAIRFVLVFQPKRLLQT